MLAIQERVLGPDHRDTLMCRMYLAYELETQGRDPDAEKEYRAVLAIRERTLGPGHADVLESCLYLAASLEKQGKLPEALGYLQRVETGRQKAFGPEHPDSQSAKSERERIEAELKKQKADGKYGAEAPRAVPGKCGAFPAQSM